MKKYGIALLICAAVACKKDIGKSNPDAAPSLKIENISSDQSLLFFLNGTTKYGCLINGSFTPDARAAEALLLHVNYVRDAVSLDQWKGKSNNLDAYAADGIKVLLNINNQLPTGDPLPFPTDMVTYRQNLTSVLNAYQPEVVVIENEEINKNYHTGSMLDYINMLKVALSVCHPKGLKVTNGGIYGSSLEILTYRYLQTKSQARADSFGNNCMSPFQVKAAQNPGSNPNLEYDVNRLDTLLAFYPNLDYVNVHLYEPFDPDVTDDSKVATPTPVVIPDIQEYLTVRTGRTVITNETGQRNNTNPQLVTGMLQEYDQLKFPYMVWFSGDGNDGAQPLYDLNTGMLFNNGIAFSAYMIRYPFKL